MELKQQRVVKERFLKELKIYNAIACCPNCTKNQDTALCLKFRKKLCKYFVQNPDVYSQIVRRVPGKPPTLNKERFNKITGWNYDSICNNIPLILENPNNYFKVYDNATKFGKAETTLIIITKNGKRLVRHYTLKNDSNGYHGISTPVKYLLNTNQKKPITLQLVYNLNSWDNVYASKTTLNIIGHNLKNDTFFPFINREHDFKKIIHNMIEFKNYVPEGLFPIRTKNFGYYDTIMSASFADRGFGYLRILFIVKESHENLPKI